MSSETRYVFDTNVLISALPFTDSVPGRVFSRSLEGGSILVSAPLVEEITDVLRREKFKPYLLSELLDRFLEGLIGEAELVEVTDSIQVCRDPRDDRILELAVCGHASFLVTGDRDLLVLNPFRGIRIVTPAELLQSFEDPLS